MLQNKTTLLILGGSGLLLIILAYFFLVRPYQRKKSAERQALIEAEVSNSMDSEAKEEAPKPEFMEKPAAVTK